MEITIATLEEYNDIQRDNNSFNKIKKITFGDFFNSYIKTFPKSLKIVIFGKNYNKK